jgi:hypothetical protein
MARNLLNEDGMNIITLGVIAFWAGIALSFAIVL